MATPVSFQDTVHGKCKVKYIVSHDKGNQTVRKFTDHKGCVAWTQENWSNMAPLCPSSPQVKWFFLVRFIWSGVV